MNDNKDNKTAICEYSKAHNYSHSARMKMTKSAPGQLQCCIADEDFIRFKVSSTTTKSINLTIKKNRTLANNDNLNYLELIKEEEEDETRKLGDDDDDDWEDDKIDEDYEKAICNICTEKIGIYATSQCNHRICYVCCLRSRFLFKSFNCAYCRTYQHQVFFTRNPKKSFNSQHKQLFFKLPNLDIFCEDKSIYEKSMEFIRLKCPKDDCRFQCNNNENGLFELLNHVRKVHKLTFCELCLFSRNLFIKEHKLYTKYELKRHFHGDNSIDSKNFNFKGHPACKSCNIIFYDHILLDEHYSFCRDSNHNNHGGSILDSRRRNDEGEENQNE
ncbi:8696_t:CDS:2, partial [Entrophospora sp. SA101]